MHYSPVFGSHYPDWLRRLLELPKGIQCHATFGNVFCAIDPMAFLEVFAQWTCCVRDKTNGEVVSLDGMALHATKGDPTI